MDFKVYHPSSTASWKSYTTAAFNSKLYMPFQNETNIIAIMIMRSACMQGGMGEEKGKDYKLG